MRVKKKTAIFLSIMLVISTLISGCGKEKVKEVTAENPLVFRMSLVDGESTNYYKGAKKISDEVFQRTDGKIKIKVISGGALGGERDTVELAMNGDLDIASAANSVLTNWIPEMSILDQAYLWENANQAHAAIDGKVGDLVQREAQKLGLHVIGYMESGFRDVFSKKPIDSIDKFRGVKIRTMQNQYHIAAFKSFGAMPTSLGFNEQFTALQQGTIDACENGVNGCWANGFYEVTKNITNSKHAFVYIVICMSDKAWNMIPDDLKDDFEAGVKAGYEAQRKYLVDANDDARKRLKEQGVKFHDIDTKALRESYQKEAKKQGFKFDPEWQTAINEALATH